MLSSAASTVEQYLAELDPERRRAVSALRELVSSHLPAGFEEGMQYGMIGYRVPLARYPDTYNGQPLTVVALASQKRYMALYLMAVYADPEKRRRLVEAFRSTGKKLDMGKSCLRFVSLDALPLEAIGALLAETSVDDFIATYENTRAGARAAGSQRASVNPAARRAGAAGTVKLAVAAKPAARRAASPTRTGKPAVSAKPAARRAVGAAGTAKRAVPASEKIGARSGKAGPSTKKGGAAARAR